MAFKQVLYAPSEKDMNEKYNRLLQLTDAEESDRCTAYFSNLWESRHDWALALCSGLPLRGNNTNHYIEVAFHILKDCMFGRVLAFSLPQLIDFIVVRYEAYMEKGLIDFSSGRYTKLLLRNMMPTESDIPHANISEVDADNGLYTVKSSSGSDVYSIDLICGYCTCFIGATGKLCKHASAVVMYRDAQTCSGYNIVRQDTKRHLFREATGRSPPMDWLLPQSYPVTDSVCTVNTETNVPSQQPVANSVTDDSSTDINADEQTVSVSADDMARLDGLLARIT